MNRLLMVLCVAGLFFSLGCGENQQLRGDIKFSDGKPVTHGTVIFATDTFLARGEIKDGAYTMGTLKAKDGLPPGTYNVYVAGVDKPVPPPKPGGMTTYANICADKFYSPKSSGLTCTVPAPKNRYDIVLEPHPKNYP